MIEPEGPRDRGTEGRAVGAAGVTEHRHQLCEA
jgi:hypothetical protein